MNAAVVEKLLWRLLAAGLFAAYLATTPVLWQCEGVDEVEYLGLAHSLATGQGYQLNGQPYGYYPPVHPFVLSLGMRLAPWHWRVLYMANAALAGLAVILAGAWLRGRFGTPGRWASWLLLTSYYGWSFSTRYLMSEPMFLLLSTLALGWAWPVVREGRRAWVAVLGVGLCCLLAALTRSGALALTAGLVAAAGLGWLRQRRAVLFGLLLAAGLGGGGTFLAWEIRAQLVVPDAPESYLRWALKFVGVETEQDSIVARNQGEGVTEATDTWPERLVFTARKTGDYLAAAVRPPPAYAALSLVLFLFVLLGAWRHLRGHPDSPLFWYWLVSVVLISLTTWVTSYTRYLYLLGPILALFFCEGAGIWWAWLQGRKRSVFIASNVLLLAGLIHAVVTWPRAIGVGGLGGYQTAMQALAVLFYAGLLGLAWGAQYPQSARRAAGFALAALLLLTAHNGAIAFQRYRLTLSNESLEQHNLAGTVQVADWIRQHSAPEAVVVAAIPRLVDFLAGRASESPVYDATGKLVPPPGGFVLLTGPLRDFPAYRPGWERQLTEACRVAEEEGFLEPVFSGGDARVYRVHDGVVQP